MQSDFAVPKKSLTLKGQMCLVPLGLPHYETFDGHYHNFPGLCVFTLLAVTGGPESALPYSFDILLNNYESIDNSGTIVVYKSVQVSFSLQQILFGRDRTIEINGKIITDISSYSDDFYGYKIEDDGRVIKFSALFGLVILYDGKQYVQVSVSRSYTRQVIGLCGNFQETLDDVLASDTNEESECRQPEPITKCDPYVAWQASYVCNAVNSSCFSSCRSVSPSTESYFKVCIQEYCKNGGTEQAVSHILNYYHLLCSVAGGSPCDDIALAFNGVSCPGNTDFEKCGNGCPQNCSNPYNLRCCPCITGCICKSGFVVNSNSSYACGPKEACACKPGESSVVAQECTEKCFCGNAPFCEPFSCFKGQECINNKCLLDCKCEESPTLERLTIECKEGCNCGPKRRFAVTGNCTAYCECWGNNLQCIGYSCSIGYECVNNTCVQTRDCPVGSFHTKCTATCQQACDNPFPRMEDCGVSCVGGCVCPEDLYLDKFAMKCVPPGECSYCSAPKRHIQSAMFYRPLLCDIACRCTLAGMVCSDFHCDSVCRFRGCTPRVTCEITGAGYRCGKPCKATCADPFPDCPDGPCVEGCHCMDGLILDESINECVIPESCGCYYEPTGKMFELGSTILNCPHACVCEPTGIRCSKINCQRMNGYCPGGICKLAQACKSPLNSFFKTCVSPVRATCSNPTLPAFWRQQQRWRPYKDIVICNLLFKGSGCVCTNNMILNETTNTCVFPDVCAGGDCFDDYGNPVPEIGRGITSKTFFFRNNCTFYCYCYGGAASCLPFYCPGDCVDNACPSRNPGSNFFNDL